MELYKIDGMSTRIILIDKIYPKNLDNLFTIEYDFAGHLTEQREYKARILISIGDDLDVFFSPAEATTTIEDSSVHEHISSDWTFNKTHHYK